MTHQKKNEIIEEFDKQFGEIWQIIEEKGKSGCPVMERRNRQIKDFISKSLDLLSKEKEQEMVEMIKVYTKAENYWDEMPTATQFQKGALSARKKMEELILSKLTPSDRE